MLYCHIPMQLHGFLYVYSLYFVNGRSDGGEDQCIHTLLEYTLGCFGGSSTFDTTVTL